jgi:polysaccharide biosynthesis protein PelG
VIVYVFAASLILTSGYHYRFTRITADLLYQKRFDQMLRWFRRAVAVSLATGSAIGIGIALAGGLTPAVAAATTVTAAAVSLSWVTMLMVSLLSNFRAIITSYIGGAVATVAIAAAGLRGDIDPTVVGLLAFAAGTIVVVAGLSLSIGATLRRRGESRHLATSAEQPAESANAPTLPAATLARIGWIGILLTAVLWIDKIVFWVAFGAPVAETRLRLMGDYDVLVFISQLLLIPAMVFFVVRVETTLYRGVRSILRAVRGGTYREVELEKRNLITTISSHNTAQRGLAILIIAIAWIFSAGLGSADLVMFVRVTIASQLYFLMYTAVVTLLYLSDYRGALTLLGIVMIVALGGAVLTVVVPAPRQVGLSYMITGAVGALLATRLQHNRLQSMDRTLLTRALL